jgi:hypothetical protein
MKTGDNKKFLRLWWEVSADKLSLNSKTSQEAVNSGKRWFPYNKGGEYRKWYGNNDYVVNWENLGAEVMGMAKEQGRHTQDYPNELKFIPMATWSLITLKPAFRYKECAISDIAGMSYFAPEDKLFYYMGFTNCVIATEIVKVLAPTMNCQAGDISRLPVIHCEEYEQQVVELVKENIAVSKADWDSFESSWDFEKHPFVLYKNNKLNTKIETAFENWKNIAYERFYKVKENEEKLNRIFLDIYGIKGDFSERVENSEVTVSLADKKRDVASFISYGVGCILGRYSLDKGGVVCTDNNWDIRNYNSFCPETHNCIAVSDLPQCKNDLTARFIEFVRTVFGEEYLAENLEFIASALDNKGDTSEEIIRDYFYNSFYKEHCRAYSVGVSGKRPVYFMVNSGKQKGFKGLCYIHRWDKNTLSYIRDNSLYNMEKLYEEIIFQLQLEDRENNELKIKQLNKRLKELKIFSEKLMSLQGIVIDLDDGVIFNHKKIQINRDGKVVKIFESIN